MVAVHSHPVTAGRPDGWYQVAAVVLHHGIGVSRTAAPCAIDAAMSPWHQLSHVPVSSAVPAGVPMFTTKPGDPVDAGGVHALAVTHAVAGRGRLPVTAGLAIAIPAGGGTGVVYHDGGMMSPAACEQQLRDQLAEAMTLRSCGEYDTRLVIASAPWQPGRRGVHRAAVASLIYLTGQMLAAWSPHLIPAGLP